MKIIVTIYKTLLLWTTATLIILTIVGAPDLLHSGLLCLLIPIIFSILGILACTSIITKEEFDTLSLNKYLRELWSIKE